MDVDTVYRKIFTIWVGGTGKQFPRLRERVLEILADPNATEADLGRMFPEIHDAGGWPDFMYASGSRNGAESAAATATAVVSESSEVQYVTRDQIASLVQRHKDTVADWFNDDPKSPKPAREGGGGKRHEYLWTEVRPWLADKSGRVLPERFPQLPGR